MPGLTDEEIAKLEREESGGGLTDEQMAELEKASNPSGPSRHISSKGESGMAGFAQGGTMGFGDELMGGIKAIGDVMGDKYSMSDLGDRYRRRRDEYRTYNEATREDNPGSYMAGEVGGSVTTALIPGMGGANIGKGMLTGAAMGLGESNADLTKGEFQQAAMDTGKGALIGGTVSAIPSAVKGGTKLAAKGYTKVSPNAVKFGGQSAGFLKGGLAGAWAGGEVAERADKFIRPLAEKLSGKAAQSVESAAIKPQNAFMREMANSPFYRKTFERAQAVKDPGLMHLLSQAAERGPQYLALTMQLLSKKNPELMSSLEQ